MVYHRTWQGERKFTQRPQDHWGFCQLYYNKAEQEGGIMSSVFSGGVFYITPSFLSKLSLLWLVQAMQDMGQVPSVSLDVNHPGAGGS